MCTATLTWSVTLTHIEVINKFKRCIGPGDPPTKLLRLRLDTTIVLVAHEPISIRWSSLPTIGSDYCGDFIDGLLGCPCAKKCCPCKEVLPVRKEVLPVRKEVPPVRREVRPVRKGNAARAQRSAANEK